MRVNPNDEWPGWANVASEYYGEDQTGLVDIFYLGVEAYDEGLPQSSCPKEFSAKHKRWWTSGFQSAERQKLNPCLPIKDYDRISKEAEAAYHHDVKTGAITQCPYPDDTEANAIWVTRYSDCHGIFDGGESDWITLGTPTQVSVEKEHTDGSVTYSMPAPNHQISN